MDVGGSKRMRRRKRRGRERPAMSLVVVAHVFFGTPRAPPSSTLWQRGGPVARWKDMRREQVKDMQNSDSAYKFGGPSGGCRATAAGKCEVVGFLAVARVVSCRALDITMQSACVECGDGCLNSPAWRAVVALASNSGRKVQGSGRTAEMPCANKSQW